MNDVSICCFWFFKFLVFWVWVVGYFFDRVMFPVIDISNNIIGFQSRTLNHTEQINFKYLNSKTTVVFKKDSMLYGFNFAFKSSLDYYIICEGNMDVITLNQNGFDNAVGDSGRDSYSWFSRLAYSNIQPRDQVVDGSGTPQRDSATPRRRRNRVRHTRALRASKRYSRSLWVRRSV